MPLTQLDPKSALVVIDLQKGIVGFPLAHPVSEIVANAAALVGAFRQKGLPVVLVNVVGGAPGRTDVGAHTGAFPPDWADLIPELDVQPSDILISKGTLGAFHGTALDMRLRRAGVTQVVLVGIATSIGVEGTARAAHEHGYNVTLVKDAMTDLSAEAHHRSVSIVFPHIGEIADTKDVLAKLGQ